MWRKIIAVGLLLGSFCCTVSAATPQMTMSVERQVYEYLTDEMGLPTSSACGVLANIEQESGFNVNAVGDHGTSYGLCQWHAGRYTALINFCKGKGLDYQTVNGQLEYLKYELETGYSEMMMALRLQENSPAGAYRAGYLWCVQFERPADAENKGVQRGNLAKGKYWNRYNSIMVVEKEAEPLPREEVLEIVLQDESTVTIPEPPEEQREAPAAGGQEEASGRRSRLMKPFIPRTRPASSDRLLDLSRSNPAIGFAVAMLFAPRIDLPKERRGLPVPEFVEIPL